MLPINNPALASKYATQIMNKLAGEAKRLAPWAAPAAIFGSWCVYPALTDNFKKDIGLPYDPKNVD